MRTLFFMPVSHIGENSRKFFRDEIVERLQLSARNDLGEITPIDAEDVYDATQWDDFISVAKTDGSNFDCVVIALDAERIGRSTANLKSFMHTFYRFSPDTPVIAYIDGHDPSVVFHLLQADFIHIVNRREDERTLAAFVARVVAARANSGRRLELGPVEIDLQTGELFHGEKQIQLSPRELQFLLMLARRKGRLISKNEILSYVYDGQEEPQERTIDVFICKLRATLNEIDPAHPTFGSSVIETVWGRGFKLVNYVPLDETLKIGPLTLYFDKEEGDYFSQATKIHFDLMDVAVLGHLADAANNAVSVEEIGTFLEDQHQSLIATSAIAAHLNELREKVKAETPDDEPFLRLTESGDWLLYNPYLARNSLMTAVRHYSKSLARGREEEVIGGLKFYTKENDPKIYVGDGGEATISATQFQLFRFLYANMGKAFPAAAVWGSLSHDKYQYKKSHYTYLLQKAVRELEAVLSQFPAYVPIHRFIPAGSIRIFVGMAADRKDLQINEADLPIANKAVAKAPRLAASQDEAPVVEQLPVLVRPALVRPRAIPTKPVKKDEEYFPSDRPFSIVDLGWFIMRVNNRSHTSFIPDLNFPFTGPETTLLLRLWDGKGEPVTAAVDKNIEITMGGLLKKLVAKNPRWANMIERSPAGYIFKDAFSPEEPATSVGERYADEQLFRAKL